MKVVLFVIVILVAISAVSLAWGGIIYFIFNTLGVASALGINDLPFLACLGIGFLLALLTSRVRSGNRGK